MPTFNTRIAVEFAGESAKLVAAEFKKLSNDVGGHLSDIKKSFRGVEGDIKGFKKLLGGALIGKVLFQGALDALDELDGRYKILGTTSREVVGGMRESLNGLMSLDIAGFSKGLADMAAGIWNGWTGVNDAIDKAEAETKKRLADPNRRKSLAENLGATTDLRTQIFGDPEKLKKEAADLAKAINLQIQGGLSGIGGEKSKNAVRQMLDDLHGAGLKIPADLQAIASSWGVMSTAQKKATEDSARETEKLNREHEQFVERVNRMLDALNPERKAIRDYAQEQVDLARAAQDAAGWTDELLDSQADSLRRFKAALENAQRAKEIYGSSSGKALDLTVGTQGNSLADVEALRLEEDRRRKIEESTAALARFRASLVGSKLTQAEINALLDECARQLGLLPEMVNKVADDWRKITLENFARGGQSALATFAAGLLDGSKDAAHAFGDQVTQLINTTVAEAFAKIAYDFGKELITAAAKAASISKSGEGQGGAMSGVKGLFGAGGSYSWLASAWPVLAVAAFVVAAKYYTDQKDKKRYGSSADVGMNGAGNFWATGTGRNPGSSGELAKGILALLRELEGATGTFITGMDRIIVEVRNDKKRFNVIGVGVFKTMEEAMVAAARAAFSSAQLSGDLAPAMREMVANFQAKTVEEFSKAVHAVQQIVDEASGLTGVEIHLREIPSLIRSVNQQLLDFGVSVGEAMSLATKWGVVQFQNAWQQISGQQLTPKQELEQKKNQTRLLVAQINLWKLELMARAAYLKGQLQLAQAEFGGGGGGGKGGGFRGTVLTVQAKLMQAEIQLFTDYLGEKRDAVKAEAKLWQAELDVINEALKAIDALLGSINVDKIKLGGGKGGGKVKGGGVGGGMDDFWDLLVGDLSSLDPTKKLAAAEERYRTALASKNKEELEAARRMYLEQVKSFYGSTAAGAEIFERVMKETSYLGAKGKDEAAARQKAINQLFNLADASGDAAAAISSLLGFGGGRKKTGGGRSAGAANVNTPGGSNLGAYLAAAVGQIGPIGVNAAMPYDSGLGRSFSAGSSSIQRAIERSGRETADQLENVSRTIRRTSRPRGGGGTTGGYTPAPPPPPAPTGTGAGGPKVTIDRVR